MSKEQEEELQYFVLYEPKLAEKVKEDSHSPLNVDDSAL